MLQEDANGHGYGDGIDDDDDDDDDAGGGGGDDDDHGKGCG